MTETKFGIGDPVWTKMKGYCPWPSRIADPSESPLENKIADKSKTPKATYLVYFFGSNNFAWMFEDTIKPYEEFKDKNKNGSKNVQFKQGLKQIEEYIATGGKAALIEKTSKANVAITRVEDPDNSPTGNGGDSPSNDASNIDGALPSIDDEIETINNKKPAASSNSSSKKSMKNSHDSHDSSSLTSPIQRDYSRTPFKSSRKAALKSSSSDHHESSSATTDHHITVTSPTKRIKTTTSTSDEDYYGLSSSINISTTSSSLSSKPPTSTKSGARNLILRGQHFDAPIIDTPQIDRSYVLPKYKDIRASNLRFGFVGVGFMGQRLLKHLISTGHKVTIWNRTSPKCKEFVNAGAKSAPTAADVVSDSDIVFLCLSSPKASKETVFGNFGILAEMNEHKALVELSSIDPETSIDISEAIVSKGGRYLEAPIVSSGKSIADKGELVIVASGCKELYEDCSTCFQAMAKRSFFISSHPGDAAKMNLTLSMLYGTIVGSVAECCSLVDKCTLIASDFREILQLSIMNCPLIDSLLARIIDKREEVHMPIANLQKDMRLALNMSEDFDASVPIAAITNEVFKSTIKMGYGSSDASAVFIKNRFL